MTDKTNTLCESKGSGAAVGKTIPKRLASVKAEHDRITVLLERATQAFLHNPASADVNAILLELSGYTLTHFREEEALMRTCGFPGLDAHKMEHDQLAAYIRGLLDVRSKQDALQGALNALNVWLDLHIRIADKRLFDFLHRGEK